jgi:gliding motility-associated protein GldC
MKKSDIRISVTLNDQKFPEKIHWSAEDSGIEGEKEAEAAMLAIWDAKDKCTLRIDLWTPRMMVEEMHHLFYETFRSMADTYQCFAPPATTKQRMKSKLSRRNLRR